MRLDHLLSKEKVAIGNIAVLAKKDKKRTREEFGDKAVVRFSGTESEKRSPVRRGCSSAGRAPALQAGGQGFDSLHLHQGEDGESEPKDECEGRYGLIAQKVRAHA